LNSIQNIIDNDDDLKLLERFVQNASLYCFSQIPKSFFGFLPNTSMNEKVHDLIKSIIPCSKPFTVVVSKIIEYLEELGSKCHNYELEKNKIEDLFDFPALKEVDFWFANLFSLKSSVNFQKAFHTKPSEYLNKFIKSKLHLNPFALLKALMITNGHVVVLISLKLAYHVLI